MGLRGKTSLLVEVQEVMEPKESFFPPTQDKSFLRVPGSSQKSVRQGEQVISWLPSSLLHATLPTPPAQGSLLTSWVHSAQSCPLTCPSATILSLHRYGMISQVPRWNIWGEKANCRTVCLLCSF